MPLMIGKDPYWQQQQQERWGQAINTFLAIRERRRQEKERQFQDQLRLLAETPELATGQFGSHFSQKWEKTHPEAPLIVDSLRSKGALAQQMRDAEIAFNQGLLQERAKRSEMFTKIQQLPDDPVQIPYAPNIGVPGMGPVVNAANLAASQVQAPSLRAQGMMAWQQAEPDWQTVLKSMPPAQQLAYFSAMQARGRELPEDPNQVPVSKMSEGIRTLIGVGAGPADVGRAARIDAGLEIAPATVEESDLIANRQIGDDERAREAARLAHERRLEEQENQGRITRRNIDYRSGASGKSGAGGEIDEETGELVDPGWAGDPKKADDERLKAFKASTDRFVSGDVDSSGTVREMPAKLVYFRDQNNQPHILEDANAYTAASSKKGGSPYRKAAGISPELQRVFIEVASKASGVSDYSPGAIFMQLLTNYNEAIQDLGMSPDSARQYALNPKGFKKAPATGKPQPMAR